MNITSLVQVFVHVVVDCDSALLAVRPIFLNTLSRKAWWCHNGVGKAFSCVRYACFVRHPGLLLKRMATGTWNSDAG